MKSLPRKISTLLIILAISASCTEVFAKLSCENLFEPSFTTSPFFNSPEFILNRGLEWHETPVPPYYHPWAGPKEWNVSETEGVRRVLTALIGTSRLKPFMDKIRGDGPVTIERYTRNAVLLGNGIWVNFPTAISWASSWHPLRRMIGVGDLYFQLLATRPSQAMRVLLHELVHIFDSKSEYSMSPEFFALLGWYQVSGKWYSTRVNYMLLNQAKLNMWSAGQLNAYVQSQFGFPSLYALENPQECLAEFVTYYAFDTGFSRFIPRDIRAWLDFRVF